MKKTVVISIGVVVAVAVIAVAGMALWNYHEQPEFCVMCHVMDPYLETWSESDYLVHTHAEEDVVCLDCHEPTISEQVQEVVAYVSGNFEEPLEKREFPNEFCLRCHEHDSYAAVAERTQDYMVMAENIGEMINVNPHDPHPDMDESTEEQFQCWHCHTMHGTSRGVNYCIGCHHDSNFDACINCH